MGEKLLKASKTIEADYIVVGAGVSGGCIAHNLAVSGQDVLLLEKARGPGGRLSERRLSGEQYSLSFRRLESWQFEKVANLSSPAARLVTNSRNGDWFRYSAPALIRELIAPLPSYFGLRLEKIQDESQSIRLELSGEKFAQCKHLILTAPMPQCYELLHASKIEQPPELSEVEYSKSLLFFEETNAGCPHEKIDAKLLESKQLQSYSLSEALSEKAYQSDQKNFLKQKGIEPVNFHSWRYAKVKNPLSKMAFAQLGKGGRIFVIGDAFLSGGFHSAVRSAEELYLSLGLSDAKKE